MVSSHSDIRISAMKNRKTVILMVIVVCTLLLGACTPQKEATTFLAPGEPQPYVSSLDHVMIQTQLRDQGMAVDDVILKQRILVVRLAYDLETDSAFDTRYVSDLQSIARAMCVSPTLLWVVYTDKKAVEIDGQLIKWFCQGFISGDSLISNAERIDHLDLSPYLDGDE